MLRVRLGSAQRRLKLDFGQLQPYMLSDGSRIVTKKSLQKVFGQSGKSDWLQEFSESFTRYGIVNNMLLKSIAYPILFQTSTSSNFPTIEEGYSIETLREICRLLIVAKELGYLSVIELKFASIAKKILDADSKSQLEWQIDQLTGFILEKTKAKQALLDFMLDGNQDLAYRWIASFTDETWQLIFDHCDSDWSTLRSDLNKHANFLQSKVFSRLDALDLHDMRRMHPKREYRTKNGFKDNMHPALKKHFQLLEATSSLAGRNDVIFEQLLSKIKPMTLLSNFEFTNSKRETQAPTVFDQQLKRALLKTKSA